MDLNKLTITDPLGKEILRLGNFITDKGYAGSYCIQGLNCMDTFLETLLGHVIRNGKEAFPVLLTAPVGDMPGTSALFAGMVVSKVDNVLDIKQLRLTYRDHHDRLDKHDLHFNRMEEMPTRHKALKMMLNRYKKFNKLTNKSKKL